MTFRLWRSFKVLKTSLQEQIFHGVSQSPAQSITLLVKRKRGFKHNSKISHFVRIYNGSRKAALDSEKFNKIHPEIQNKSQRKTKNPFVKNIFSYRIFSNFSLQKLVFRIFSEFSSDRFDTSISMIPLFVPKILPSGL